MNRYLLLMSVAGLLAGCSGKEKAYDATGTFEATETTVYAEQNGQLLTLNADEGTNVTAGEEIALVDTTAIWLQIKQLRANKNVFASQKPDMQKQIAATRQQLAKAKTEQHRYSELVADGAAPRKMLDDAKSQVDVLQKQLEAQISALSTNTRSLDSQMHAVDAQVDQLYDQLEKCHVKSPISGTVIEKYVERGELVAAGKPLAKIADVENMFLRAYLTSAQLKDIKLGQKVTVMSDYGNERKTYEGVVTWISSRSEFTPKTILTDDERADLVYAVKIAVKNDGLLKIGMYGEVKINL
ncbi:MAG: HlyD family efflux transporter periplasmic adaptor subunit [Muribaculaceae bacterium]|nr:HlyD family efflux transporter periplasmic adaptor subunit [Muribaculaceae bacterium]